MRIPYLQLDEHFITTQAPMIAALTGLDVDTVIGKGVRLFAFVIAKTSSAEKPPDGVLMFPEAVTVIEGIAGWTGTRGVLAEAFITAGTIERLEVGVRVRGCDRYRATWEKNKRDRQRAALGRATQSPRRSGDVAATSGGETETETETERESVRAPAPASPTPLRSAAESNSTRRGTEPPTSDARAGELFAGLVAAWEAIRPTAITRDVPRERELAAFLVTEDVTAPIPIVIRAYRLFLQDEHWRKAGWPWAAWKSQWKSKVAAATEAGPTAGHGGRVLRPIQEGA